MDPSDLKKLHRVATKLLKSGTLVELTFSQPMRSPPREQALGKRASELPTWSFPEDPRVADDMVQSLLPTDLLRG